MSLIFSELKPPCDYDDDDLLLIISFEIISLSKTHVIGRIHGAIVAAIVAATGRSDRRGDRRGDDRPVYTPYNSATKCVMAVQGRPSH